MILSKLFARVIFQGYCGRSHLGKFSYLKILSHEITGQINMTATYSVQEVAKHMKSDDVWIILHNKGMVAGQLMMKTQHCSDC